MTDAVSPELLSQAFCHFFPFPFPLTDATWEKQSHSLPSRMGAQGRGCNISRHRKQCDGSSSGSPRAPSHENSSIAAGFQACKPQSHFSTTTHIHTQNYNFFSVSVTKVLTIAFHQFLDPIKTNLYSIPLKYITILYFGSKQNLGNKVCLPILITKQIFRKKCERTYFLWLSLKYLWLIMLNDLISQTTFITVHTRFYKEVTQCGAWESDLFGIFSALMHAHCVIFDKLYIASQSLVFSSIKWE